MKIYISGKISGLPEAEAFKNFDTATEILVAMGYSVVNPMYLPHNHEKTWEAYMKEDIEALMKCDAIFMLKNWRDSKGAKIEHDLAECLNFKIFYQ
jgi:hypothetical protein